MRVIGTAGHVDHGKSALIAALTGTHPDRLKEEQEREMTIDLGFGWMKLTNGEEIGIIDVPGHRDFIENMLAGVGGIDAVMLVIAADEGVMPQTAEHLAIIDLLQIPAGLIALNKIDLIEDPEWLDLVEEEIREQVRGTVLERAPIVRVSARSGAGLNALRQTLTDILQTRPQRPDQGRPRLSVDRVFSLPGFGTIVTGTLLDGRLRIGDEITLLPDGKHGRIRGLQSHKKTVQEAEPGGRTAINISGLSVDDIRRGDVVTLPGQYRPTARFDARLRLLPDAPAPLEHNKEIKLFIGASERLARIRLLGAEQLAPGESGWVQIECRPPVVAVRNDRFIIRRPSPPATLGGGVVIEPHPGRRHRRFRAEVIQRLETLEKGTPADLLLQASQRSGAARYADLLTAAHLNKEQGSAAVAELLERGEIIHLGKQLPPRDKDVLIASVHWQSLQQDLLHIVRSYHREKPLSQGISREEAKSRLGVLPQVLNGLIETLVQQGQLRDEQARIALQSHQVRFTPQQQSQVDALLAQFAASPTAPPDVKACRQQLGPDLYQALVENGQLVQVSPDIVFRAEDYQAIREKVRQFLLENGPATVAQIRDLLGTTRKYVLALLEHFDQASLTHRDGDYRTWKGG